MTEAIDPRIVMEKQISSPRAGDLCALNQGGLYRKNLEVSVAGKLENNHDEDHSKPAWL
jgi:hypothetical protein